MIDAALNLAGRGWRVFPVATPTADGGCSCGKPCSTPGKHPRVKAWDQEATTDEAMIRRWWKRWPDANIGIATGVASGLVVVDVDAEGAGTPWLNELPDTIEAVTGSGGRHILFQHPGGDQQIGNRQKLEQQKGVDIRGDGGYIVAPPSLHPSGRRYEWDAGYHPEDMPLAPLPGWLLDRLLQRPENGAAWEPSGQGWRPVPLAPVLEGCGWLQASIHNAATLSEAEWLAQLQLAGRLEEGARLAHEWSRPYPNYTPEETAKKLAHAVQNTRPPSCSRIRAELGGEPHCAVCPNAGKVRSPIALGNSRLRDLDAYAPPEPKTRPVPTPRPVAQPEPLDPAAGAPTWEPDNGGAMTLTDAWATVQAVDFQGDAGGFFEPDALTALSLLRSYHAQNWTRAKGLLRGKVALGDLTPLLPEVSLAPSDRAEFDSRLPTEMTSGQKVGAIAGDQLADSPRPDLVIPFPYTLAEGNVVWNGTTREGGPAKTVVAHSPLLIVGKLFGARGRVQYLLLAWRNPRTQAWETRVVERSEAFSKKLAMLARDGAPVNEVSTRDVISYLVKLEAANERLFPAAQVSDQLGWLGAETGESGYLVGRTLILPDGEIIPAKDLNVERPETWDERTVAYHGLGDGGEQIVDGFHSAGTLEAWVELIATCRSFWKVMFLFYAGFVPPLLEVLDIPNFIVDLSGATSKGKSTASRLPASIWGMPDEKVPASVIHIWNASKVFLERVSAVITDGPLFMDDTKNARDKREVAAMVYAVTSGRGRGRGTPGGIAATQTWRTVMFSNGEAAITSFTQDGGTRTRTLALHGLPFDRADETTAPIVAKLNAGLRQNYGHAAPLFVQWLLRERERERWDEWRDYYNRVQQKLASSPPSPEAGRLAQYAAAITVASAMAHRALPLTWEWSDPVAPLWDSLATEASEASGAVRALEAAFDWAVANEHSFHGRFPAGPNGSERIPSGSAAGRWDEGDWRFIAFNPTVLRRVLQEQGFEEDAVLREWRDRGWIRARKGKFTWPLRMRGDPDNPDAEPGTPPKMVVVLREAFDQL